MFLLTDLSIHDARFVFSSQVNVDGSDVVISSSMHAENVGATISPINTSATLASSCP